MVEVLLRLPRCFHVYMGALVRFPLFGEVTVRDFVWNLCNGTLYYDRKILCPCGKIRNTEHILFSCSRLKNIRDWFSTITQLTSADVAGEWNEKNIFQILENPSSSSLSVALYISLLKSLWVSRDAPTPSKNIFKETLQSIMISEWYFSNYHPDYKFIPYDLKKRFYVTWDSLFKLTKTKIPVLKNW